jgi:hypothetical protein
MKIYDTVKTEEKAIEILQAWLASNNDESLFSTDTLIEPTEVRCECGTTTGMRACFENTDIFAIVAVCDCCGDDDADVNDVLIIR